MSTQALVYESELLSALQGELRVAEAFHMAIALITMTGLPLLADGMRRCLEKGGKGEVVVGIDLPSHPDALAELAALQEEFPGRFSVAYFKSPGARWFHPKLYIFTPRRGMARAVVGSSNMTGGGLKNNYEASFWSDDRKAVRRLSEYFAELHDGGHSHPITDSWLARYRKVWAERCEQQKEAEKGRDKARRISQGGPSTGPKRIRGHKFVFTGGIEGWPRERRLYPRIRKLGGEVGETASSLGTADCLVHSNQLGGHHATVKLKAAKKLGVPLVSEDEFMQMLNA